MIVVASFRSLIVVYTVHNSRTYSVILGCTAKHAKSSDANQNRFNSSNKYMQHAKYCLISAALLFWARKIKNRRRQNVLLTRRSSSKNFMKFAVKISSRLIE